MTLYADAIKNAAQPARFPPPRRYRASDVQR
jgi:hypothetical protein